MRGLSRPAPRTHVAARIRTLPNRCPAVFEKRSGICLGQPSLPKRLVSLTVVDGADLYVACTGNRKRRTHFHCFPAVATENGKCVCGQKLPLRRPTAEWKELAPEWRRRYQENGRCGRWRF